MSNNKQSSLENILIMYYILTTTGEVTELLPPVALENLQKAVGGYIEPVNIHGKKYLYCNEEGVYASLSLNPVASFLTNRQILGDVVLVEFTKKDIQEIEDLYRDYLMEEATNEQQ